MATVSLAEIEADPARYQRCSNGVIRDGVTNRFVRAAGNSTAFTSRDATRLNKQRWDMARQAATSGLASLKGTENKTLEWIFKNQAALAGATKRGIASTKAAEFVMTKGGYTPERSQGAAGTTVNIINVVEGAGAADLLREVRDIDVIDHE